MKRSILFKTLVLALGLACCVIFASTSTAGPKACDNRVNNTPEKLMQCVTLEGVREHQAAFQAIADVNNGNRVSGSPGYDDSVDYVVDRMEAAGYLVTVQTFEFQTFISLSPSILEQLTPAPVGPIANNIMSYSGSGDVTAVVSTLPVITDRVIMVS